jgi:hypothetical protein
MRLGVLFVGIVVMPWHSRGISKAVHSVLRLRRLHRDHHDERVLPILRHHERGIHD